MHLRYIIVFCAILTFLPTIAGNDTPESQDSTFHELESVTITARPKGVLKPIGRADNTHIITTSELRRAACCNLGESFTTNPSVDVSYNDAATGARQIKLLGLSGAYVQMLTENYPNFRGAASPYGLGYVPGTWMQSIQVSKGASSVKNGYESMSGQINIEFKKPQAEEEIAANAYIDHTGRMEANANANMHINQRLSTGLLLHYENTLASHDNNNDGFMDMPSVRQYSGMNRWAWMGDNYVFQAGIKFLDEKRTSGQSPHHTPTDGHQRYTIGIDTRRWEAFTKNAYIFDKEHDGNVALILSGSYHDMDSHYGLKLYDVTQGNLYASLMFERKFNRMHSLSTGLSFNYDHYDQSMRLTHSPTEQPHSAKEIEGVGGAYLQYTLNLDTKLLLMLGLRYDHSSVSGSMVTPRMHIKWNPTSLLSLHASAGRGFRNTHVMAEYNYLLASSRSIIIAPDLHRECAWNFGIGTNLAIPVSGRTLDFSAEYYYTDFSNQLVVDLDSDPHSAIFKNSPGKSYSHTLQIEASYPILSDLNLTAAYRYTDVKVDFGHGLTSKPLTGRSKTLISASYGPNMGIWQFDVTLAVNGGARMPSPYISADGQQSWPGRYHTFCQLSAQITRNFRRWAVYIGGENLTNYRQRTPIIGASDPWGDSFDATMIYAPVHGAIIYAGFRFTLKKY